MASKFLPGMKNVLEVLNQMWDAFAAGPYNALPLSGGTMTGPLAALDQVFVTADDFATRTVLVPPPALAGNVAGRVNTALRLGVVGQAQVAYSGRFTVGTSFAELGGGGQAAYSLHVRASDDAGGPATGDLLKLTGQGIMYAPVLKAGSHDSSLQYHCISRTGQQGAPILYVGLDVDSPSIAMQVAGVYDWATPAAVMHVGTNTVTRRSIAVGGTVSTGGNDYAEYFFKCLRCGLIMSGQIVGITADNSITDRWADAVMFAIKSTAPSFVGGDTWANGAGPRPLPQAGPVPAPPPRRADVIEQRALPGTNPPEYQEVVTPGDTDAEWAAKQAAYAAALAAHDAAVRQDAEAMAAFDAALEVERQKVDRIAIAGRVPVNVLDAQPGDYIVPVQDGDGIKGIPVRQADLSHLQYLQAVGRVISIEPDGRAYVMVKVV